MGGMPDGKMLVEKSTDKPAIMCFPSTSDIDKQETDEYIMGDLLSFAYPEMLKLSFPEMFKEMYMATVQVNLRRVNNNPIDSVYGKIAALIRHEPRHSVSFRVGSMLFTCTDTTPHRPGFDLEAPLELARSVVAVPPGWVLRIEVDLHIKIPNSNLKKNKDNRKDIKHLKVTFDFNKENLSPKKELPRDTGIEVEVKITWEGKQYFPPQLSRPVEVMVKRMMSWCPTVVYTIGDDVMSFTEFIIALRRVVADYQGRQDILDGHDLLNLYSTREHPVLPKQLAEEPARWIHIKLQVKEGKEILSTTLVMRDDNLYVHGFFDNQDRVLYRLVDNEDSISVIPEGYHHATHDLKWGISYTSLLHKGDSSSEKKLDEAQKCEAIATSLTAAGLLGHGFATKAVRVLSRFREHEADGVDPSRALLAGLIVMICESARMNLIHNSVAVGWSNGMNFTKEMVGNYLWGWKRMSEKLQEWKSGGYVETPPISELHAVNLVLNRGGRNAGRRSRKGPNRKRAHNDAVRNDGSGRGLHKKDGKGSGGGAASKSEVAGDAGNGSGGPAAIQPGEAGGGVGSTSQPSEADDTGASRGNSSSQPEEAGDYKDPSQPTKFDDSQGYEQTSEEDRDQTDEEDRDQTDEEESDQPGEADDIQGHGRPLVELLAMRANLGDVRMTIMVFDGKRGQIIYRHKEQGEQGTMVDLVLTGPYTRISAHGCFAIKIDNPDAPPIKWEWDGYDPEYAAEIDEQPVTRKIENIAEVTYAVMSNALEATVKVKLRLGDGQSPSAVDGTIIALIDGFHASSVLFSGTQPADDSWLLLQLARNVVAVPCGRVLHIKMKLKIQTSNNQEVKHFEADLKFANGIPCQCHKDSGGIEVEVNIIWYPEVNIEEIGKQKFVAAASEPGRREGVRIEEVGQQPEPSRQPETEMAIARRSHRPEQTREEIGGPRFSGSSSHCRLYDDPPDEILSEIGDRFGVTAVNPGYTHGGRSFMRGDRRTKNLTITHERKDIDRSGPPGRRNTLCPVFCGS